MQVQRDTVLFFTPQQQHGVGTLAGTVGAARPPMDETAPTAAAAADVAVAAVPAFYSPASVNAFESLPTSTAATTSTSDTPQFFQPGV